MVQVTDKMHALPTILVVQCTSYLPGHPADAYVHGGIGERVVGSDRLAYLALSAGNFDSPQKLTHRMVSGFDGLAVVDPTAVDVVARVRHADEHCPEITCCSKISGDICLIFFT